VAVPGKDIPKSAVDLSISISRPEDNIPDYEHLRIVTQAASELPSVCIDERVDRLRQHLEERSLPTPHYYHLSRALVRWQ
jgi:hypothetical protein